MGVFYHTGNFQDGAMGDPGFNELESADAATSAGVYYYAIKALEDSAVTATCHPSHASGDTSFDATILGGDTVYGRFSVIDLTSGKILAYLEPV